MLRSGHTFAFQTKARTAVVAFAAASSFSAIPAGSSVAVAAHNIFARGQFRAEFGPSVTFSIARASLVLVWSVNVVTFILFSLAIASALRKRPPAGRLVLAALLTGCAAALPIVLLQPLRVWFWLTLGPLGAIAAHTLTVILPVKAASFSKFRRGGGRHAGANVDAD